MADEEYVIPVVKGSVGRKREHFTADHKKAQRNAAARQKTKVYTKKVAEALYLSKFIVMVPEDQLRPFQVQCDADLTHCSELVDFAYNKEENLCHHYCILDLVAFKREIPAGSVNPDTQRRISAICDPHSELCLDHLQHADLHAIKTAMSLEPMYEIGNERTEAFDFPSVNLAIGALLKDSLKIPQSTGPAPYFQVAFVKQRNLIPLIAEHLEALCGFFAKNFDFFLDGTDFHLYEPKYLGLQGPLYNNYFQFIMELSAKHYMKVYPPPTTMHFFKDKKKSYALMGPLMFPTVFLRFPITLQYVPPEMDLEVLQPWNGARWEDVHTYALTKLQGLPNAGSILDANNKQVILKPAFGAGGIGVVIIGRGPDGTGEVTARGLDGTVVYAHPRDWMAVSAPPVEHMVQPYVEDLRKRELRFFFKVNKNSQLERLFMVPTEMNAAGKMEWYPPIDKESKEDELYTMFDRQMVGWPKKFEELMKLGKYPAMVRHLTYRIDLCYNTARTGKQAWTINEIGLVPPNQTFMDESSQSMNSLRTIAQNVGNFCHLNLRNWPR